MVMSYHSIGSNTKSRQRRNRPIHWPQVADVDFIPMGEQKSVVKVKLPPPEIAAADILNGLALEKGQTLHFFFGVERQWNPEPYNV